ncbi:class I SAM-dependent methyltransferase [Lutibacter sp.]|uniref:class I SAM-dependent methyltransferase n=1 Tax=Lutibacter sp. TaxID=1925666 RepID=UPI0027329C38|nr:class I SAM-dependent methyltransferase [Lutibacter sp.]MDP3313510.1 class I SAM-dependent methyltransferase [Lutibacter sp.]
MDIAENSLRDFEKHWNNAYLKTNVENLGWYEENPQPSIELIVECNLPKDAILFNAGAGATTLIDNLLEQGYTNIIVNDISSVALGELRDKIVIPKSANVTYIVDDLTNPTELNKLNNIDLWHDRAVLHFFTEFEQQTAYFNLIRNAVKTEGYVILAEFNLEGAKKCCGLNVVNYDENMLQKGLGKAFKLKKSFNYTYTQPSGNTREYVYTLFQKMA